MVYAAQDSCPLTVKVTLHVPEHFVADGESIVVVQTAAETCCPTERRFSKQIPAFYRCDFIYFTFFFLVR